MQFELPPLPYPKDALEPHISAETLEFHYEKHHRGYLEKLRKSIEDKPEAEQSLEELICTASGDLFNNAAQVWNHSFYWRCMKPDGGGRPDDNYLQALIEDSFRDFEKFRDQLSEAATGEFGSGWAWLVCEPNGRLSVRSSSDAENPLQRNRIPLLTIDVWEHAYYIDYRNERARYVEAFLDHLVNWDFVASNLVSALASMEEGVEGEGNRTADRRYRDAASRFADSDRAEEAARRAADHENG